MSVQSMPTPMLMRNSVRPQVVIQSETTISELYIILRSTDPGYAWGSAILEMGQATRGYLSGECGSTEDLREEIRRVIRQARATMTGHELVVSCGGERILWDTICLNLPAGVRLADPIERAGGRVLNIVANMKCPATITQVGTKIASDGSVSPHTGHAGFGWIADNGAFGLGKLGVTLDVCHAELAGAQSALRMVSPRAQATLYIDSKEAIALIGKQLLNGSGGFVTKNRRRRQLQRIDRSPIRTVTIQKVAAHSGDALNEGADRLARLARRGSEAGMTEQTLWKTAVGIRDEVMNGIKR